MRPNKIHTPFWVLDDVGPGQLSSFGIGDANDRHVSHAGESSEKVFEFGGGNLG